MTFNLAVTKREKNTAAEGCVPAVVYGPKQESISLNVDVKTFNNVLKEAGESSIIVLDGLDEPVEVLIHDMAFNPVKGGVQHIDFYAIERGKELTTNVPLEYVNEAPAVEDKDGVLNKVLYEVEVTCRPSVLPHHIEVDLSGLTELDTPISVSDLKLPEGVKVENDPEDVVAIVSAVVEEPEEEPEEVDMDAVEVEEKGKAEDVESGESDAESE